MMEAFRSWVVRRYRVLGLKETSVHFFGKDSRSICNKVRCDDKRPWSDVVAGEFFWCGNCRIIAENLRVESVLNINV